MPGNVFAVSPWTSLDIGKGCAISWGVTFLTNDGHTIFDVRTGQNLNSTEEISRKRKIVVGDHVWIGCMSTILYGSIIGDGSIIGAHSLVKRRVPNNCLAAGNPTRIIRRGAAIIATWISRIVDRMCSSRNKKTGMPHVRSCGIPVFVLPYAGAYP